MSLLYSDLEKIYFGKILLVNQLLTKKISLKVFKS